MNLREEVRTEGRWRGNDQVTRSERGDGGADGENLSNAFVAADSWQFRPDGIDALYPVDVGRVDRSGEHLDADIVVLHLDGCNFHQFRHGVGLAVRIVHDGLRRR